MRVLRSKIVGIVALITASCGSMERSIGVRSSGGSSGLSGSGSPSAAGRLSASGGRRDTAGPEVTAGSPVESNGGAAREGGAGGRSSVPITDTTVSAQYQWSECGRIPATPRPERALYAADGSILVLEATAGVRVYGSGSSASLTLVKAQGVAESADLDMALSSDGRRLLVGDYGGLDVYVAPDGEPIGASSGQLVSQVRLNLAGSPCTGPVGFSADGTLLVGQGTDTVCIWDAASGVARSELSLPYDSGGSERFLVGVAAGPRPVRIVRHRTLFVYTLAGESTSVDLTSRFASGDSFSFVGFSPDATVLIALASPSADGSSGDDLVAIDTTSGSVRWRRPAANDFQELIFSNDGHVLLERGDVYRLADGEILAQDHPLTGSTSALGPQARTKLLCAELVAEWDLAQQKLVAMYGSHTAAVRALDISRDGEYLASHGRRGVMWKLEPDFEKSLPVLQDAASDVSWNVAIAADASALIVSGDTVSWFHAGDGTYQSEPLPPALPDCLSPDWSFSPQTTLVAGSHYGSDVEVRDARDFSLIRTLSATNCAGGVAFSPDGSSLATASLELFDTADWTRRWDRAPVPLQGGAFSSTESAVEFSPDGQELVITRCLYAESPDPCASERYSVDSGLSLGPVLHLSSDRVRYSPEGHWLVSGGQALHLPSGDLLEYSREARVALFTPEGDIIAGTQDGALVRYCRSTP